MTTHLGLVTVVVRDYDEAIASYRDSSGSTSWKTLASRMRIRTLGPSRPKASDLQNRIGDASGIT